MFKTIEICNYRGIHAAKLEGLSQVNLFFGKNNCGKTSILESLFLIAGQSNPLLLFNANVLRGYASFAEQDISLNFYNLDEKKIKISADGDNPRMLEISAFHSQGKDVSLSDIEGAGTQVPLATYGLNLEYKSGSNTYSSKILFSNKADLENKGRVKIDKGYRESIYAEYLPPSYLQVPFEGKYAEVVADKQEAQIVDILRTIEPKIKDLHLVGKNLLVDIGLERRLPINVMGDGIRKLVSIILSVHHCRNGILLVDEIDNGFHFSAMEQMWKAIFTSAAANNTQVFITTHNLESMKAMVSMLGREGNKTYPDMLSAYKLIKTQEDDVIGVKYIYDEMNYILEQEIEIR